MTAERGVSLLLAALLAAALLLAGLLAAAPSAYAAGRTLAVQAVDATGFPRVSLQVLVPPELDGTPRFAVRENGVARPVTALATAKAAVRVPLAVVLLVDTSGSMKGVPLQEARRAAEQFVGALQEDDRVAVVAFSDTPRVVQPFTTDRVAIGAALSALRAGGETALNDSVVEGARLAASAPDAARTIVLLSDGGDTASSASREAMLETVAKASVPVYALGLTSPEADPVLLADIAKQSRGRTFAVADAGSLTRENCACQN
jgi:tight adherence protein B